MQFIHGFGLTHTDLKLENLLFTTNSQRIRTFMHCDGRSKVMAVIVMDRY